MPDLNELLRWSIENSVPPATGGETPAQPLSLRFNPTSNPQAGTSALHPSDPLYRTNVDNVSPASTPGPATPTGGANTLPTIPKSSGLNSEILELIMGKSDSVTMKEKMAYAVDERNDIDSRVEALDDFEMLIESIDNANNMTVLKLWEPLLSLLDSEHDPIIAHACWILGTAVQNNLKAQAALYVHNALSLIMDIISPAQSSRGHPRSTRSKATYAFSSALKHWPLAASVLSSASDQGYRILAAGVVDTEVVIRRKMAFLTHTLVLQSDERYEGEIPKEVRDMITTRMKELGGQSSESLVDGLKRTGVFAATLNALVGSADDVEFEENAMRTLAQAAKRGALAEEEKKSTQSIWSGWGVSGQEERGLTGQDGADITAALQ